MSTAQKMNSYSFIDYLRVLGMFFISWPHLTTYIVPDWKGVYFVQWLFTQPLSIIQSFGAVGVGIFFVISGFLLAENNEGPSQFVFKKGLKIFLPVICSNLLFALIHKIIGVVFNYHSYWSQLTILNYLKSATLYSYWTGESYQANPPLWYLAPLTLLFVFYVIWRCFKIKSLFNFVIFADCGILLCYFILPQFGLILNPILAYIPFVTIPIFGYLINLLKTRRISYSKFITGTFANYIISVYGFYTFQTVHYQQEPYLTSTAFAILIFSLASFMKLDTALPRSVSWLVKISFSFYVTHNLYGGLVVGAFSTKLPYGICVLLGYCTAIAAAYMNYNLIEKPIGRLTAFLQENLFAKKVFNKA